MSEPEAGSGTESAVPKKISDKVLPTVRVGLSKQFDLLRAYAAQHVTNGNKAVKVQDAASLINLNADTARTPNNFFVDTGLLLKAEAGSYIPTPDTISFYRACEWKQPDPEHKLQPTLRETWFAKAILGRLSFKPLEEQETIGYLAEAANATPEAKPQLVVLLGLLETVGLVKRDGNTISAARALTPPPGSETKNNQTKREEHREDDPPAGKAQIGTAMRTVNLPACKGTLTLSGNFNPLELAGEERKLVYEIVDMMNAFARGEPIRAGAQSNASKSLPDSAGS